MSAAQTSKGEAGQSKSKHGKGGAETADPGIAKAQQNIANPRTATARLSEAGQICA